MAKQVKKQNAKPDPKQAPSAADFLNHPQVDQAAEKSAKPVEESPETPALEATPEPPAPQEPVHDVRETIRYPRRGDDCPTGQCPGKLSEFSRRRIGRRLILFLRCSACNAKPTPNKEVINS